MLYTHFIYRVPNYMVIYSGAIFESDFQPYFSAKLAFNLWSPSSPCINGSCTKHHFSWKVPFLFGSQDKIFNQEPQFKDVIGSPSWSGVALLKVLRLNSWSVKRPVRVKYSNQQ